MASVPYRYNPETCQYEPVYLTGKRLVKKAVGFFSTALGLAFIIFFWYVDRFTPIEEQLLRKRNEALKMQWAMLRDHVDATYGQLSELTENDDYNYRTILDLPPLSPLQRRAGVGGTEAPYLKELKQYDLILREYERITKLKHQVEVERQSFEELNQVTDNKLTMWASRPAIQPVSNTELNRLHTTFGMRMHPIFKTLMDHRGLDFTASKGAAVYATGDGRVSMAYFSGTYGNVVFIDHGFDYETRYAHLYKFVARPGQYVKRGELIGYVGNTGVSVSPHLHYEVHFKGAPVNPIYFFQRDLNNAEYQRLIETSGKSMASLD